jgi:alkaline phosphatase D
MLTTPFVFDQLRQFEARTKRLKQCAPQLTRRHFLQSALSLAAVNVFAAAHTTTADAQTPSSVRFTGYPFPLGVASGAPRAEGVVLWTRLAPEPMAASGDGGMGAERVNVSWEVASDEAFKKIVKKGTQRAIPELAHSLHVEVTGLQPGRWYWYRFMAGNEVSQVGRTRTADVTSDKLRFVFASCQQYEQGYFSAYRHIAKENIDLVVFLGDYIYEANWGSSLVRRHAGPEIENLAQYRGRHAQYKLDADLQAMHAIAPWIVTWDDHEVDNDYANDQSEHLDPRFLLRRAAAYQAYYEHMPLALSALPRGADMRLYDQFSYGELANFQVLDDRQYRSPQVCPRPGMGGSTFVENCAARLDPTRSMLGDAQEKWLFNNLGTSKARWNIIAQQTLLAQFDLKAGAGQSLWTDGWDGYPASRTKLIDFMADKKIANPIIIGGDVHTHNVAAIKRDFDNPRSATVASEFCGTSITSEAGAQDRLDAVRGDNPHILLSDGRKRGYVVMELSSSAARADLRVIDNEKLRESQVSTLASFVVGAGKEAAGPQRV